jgi:hypothetical protein
MSPVEPYLNKTPGSHPSRDDNQSNLIFNISKFGHLIQTLMRIALARTNQDLALKEETAQAIQALSTIRNFFPELAFWIQGVSFCKKESLIQLFFVAQSLVLETFLAMEESIHSLAHHQETVDTSVLKLFDEIDEELKKEMRMLKASQKKSYTPLSLILPVMLGKARCRSLFLLLIDQLANPSMNEAAIYNGPIFQQFIQLLNQVDNAQLLSYMAPSEQENFNSLLVRVEQYQEAISDSSDVSPVPVATFIPEAEALVCPISKNDQIPMATLEDAEPAHNPHSRLFAPIPRPGSSTKNPEDENSHQRPFSPTPLRTTLDPTRRD